MKHVILTLLTLSVLGISCKTDPPAPPPPSTLLKYMSLTAGSTWNYELTNNLTAATSTFILTSTSRDSTSNGKSYHVFTNSSSANEYYNITGTDYFTFRKLPASLGGTSVEFNYLKDDSPKGTSWVQSAPVTVSGFPMVITLTNTITDKGISKTIKGIAYDDVIQVTTTMEVKVNGIPLPAGALTTNINAYYARKFGLIQYNNKVSLNYLGFVENTDQQTNLVSAIIN